MEITSNDIFPWLPYFFTKCFKKRFDGFFGTVVGIVVVNVFDVAGGVCSAKTVCFIKCTYKIALKTYFNNDDVILPFVQ